MAKRTARSQTNDPSPLEAAARPKPVRKAGRAVASAAPMRSASNDAPTERAATEVEIRDRAYLRYLDRGGHHGGDFDDWLYAEQELKKK